ncbi:uncharacterized protein Z518_06798 [Rhinocladiella mackenziei CBS 650.93]|uniref:H/ACA ribonucleoprotein complex non-core subunit NAF1 n=1 Tax=Rhinocladiella mackenziei CBS 650.93 TaxID=1442369 RepID=A0A0D2IIY5_9EURO|nr:uncharacterized protein Z518_06798 [Rhinocladiella mackenziei CBS 650.93]KIX03246.1 hypothetical protein Z518_06798 [Rhinocladiella mackenziei CBS 650.93]
MNVREMDVDDFPTSPAKRQRTNSPEETHDTSPILEAQSPFGADGWPDGPPQPPRDMTQVSSTTRKFEEAGPGKVNLLHRATLENQDSNALLDALMLQVEAESIPMLKGQTTSIDPVVNTGAREATENGDVAGKELEKRKRGGQEIDGDEEQDKPAGGSGEGPSQPLEENSVAVGADNDPMDATNGAPNNVDTNPTSNYVKQEDIAAVKPDTDDLTFSTGNTRALEKEPLRPRGENLAAVSTRDDRMDIIDGIANGANENTAGHREERGDATALHPDTNTSIPTVANTSNTAAASPDPESITVDTIPARETPPPEPGAEGAECEVDSSPYESSTDSDSSSDTTSSEESDEDADGDYAMLDAEATARILMQGDGGSDDEGGRLRDKTDGAPLRTANERAEEIIPKPDITVTEEMKIEELGNVEFVVESTVVIKAKTSGEYQVLEAGSLICLKDRTVVGVIADLIGRVEEPRYTVRFTNDDDIQEAGLSAVGTTVFYVPDHSTFVFTQPLKNIKGSDASNFHDEEVGEDEMEFSDDEAEAEHKRQMKAKRQGRLSEMGRGRGGSKFNRGSHRGGRRGSHSHINNSEGAAYGNGSLEMNYDDVADTGGDDEYTPLQRPANLVEMIAKGEQSQEHGNGLRHPLPLPPPSPQIGRGDFGGRGRGHGRGGRGGYRPHRGAGGSLNQHRAPPFNNHNDSTSTHPNGFPRKDRSTALTPNLNLPPTPSITPHNITYPPVTPSPITPLPYVPYSFGGFQPSSAFPFMPQSITNAPPSAGFPDFHAQQLQQQQQQIGHQPQQNQNQIPPPPNGSAPPNPFGSGPWASNPAVAAALQRQVEEKRRSQGP